MHHQYNIPHPSIEYVVEEQNCRDELHVLRPSGRDRLVGAASNSVPSFSYTAALVCSLPPDVTIVPWTRSLCLVAHTIRTVSFTHF